MTECWYLAAFALAGALVMVSGMRSAFRRRRRQFAGREPLRPEVWFARFYPTDAVQQVALTELLFALGQDLEIKWTQLRPDDSFERSFSLPGFEENDLGLNSFYLAEAEWFRRYGINPAHCGRSVDRLGDYLKEMARLFEAAQPKEEPLHALRYKPVD